MSVPFFFIVNARIGDKKIQALREAVHKYLPGEGALFLTEYGGHATVLAQQALQEKASYVIAVGGDGTVNEVVQVLAHSTISMGIVPTGSGNGLARHCLIPLHIAEAVALLKNAKLSTIDLGKANDKYFISNAGVGFDAQVCQTIKETKSRGLAMYIRKVIQHYFTYKKDTYTITTDSKSFQQEAFFLNVANGKEFGYGFEIAPVASLQDGMLDMILVKSIHFMNGFRFVWNGWRGKLMPSQNCLYLRTTRLEVEGANLRYFQTDGDAHDCQGRCVIEIHPKALNLLVHPNAVL